MKTVTFFVSAFIVSLAASAAWEDLNPLLRTTSPYVQIDANGAIVKPLSAITFRRTSTGWDSEYESLKRIIGKNSNYYISIPKTKFVGKGSLVESTASGVVAITNCNGNFEAKNTEGINCSTISVQSCTQLFQDFTDIENPAMTNNVVYSAFKDARKSKDASFADAFRQNLRQCSDAFMTIENMNSGGSRFGLDKAHLKALTDNIKSYPVRNATDNDMAHSLHQATQNILNKAEVFTKCGDLLRQDMENKGRSTLIPAKTGRAVR